MSWFQAAIGALEQKRGLLVGKRAVSSDAVAFAREVLGFIPDEQQTEVLAVRG